MYDEFSGVTSYTFRRKQEPYVHKCMHDDVMTRESMKSQRRRRVQRQEVIASTSIRVGHFKWSLRVHCRHLIDRHVSPDPTSNLFYLYPSSVFTAAASSATSTTTSSLASVTETKKLSTASLASLNPLSSVMASVTSTSPSSIRMYDARHKRLAAVNRSKGFQFESRHKRRLFARDEGRREKMAIRNSLQAEEPLPEPSKKEWEKAKKDDSKDKDKDCGRNRRVEVVTHKQPDIQRPRYALDSQPHPQCGTNSESSKQLQHAIQFVVRRRHRHGHGRRHIASQAKSLIGMFDPSPSPSSSVPISA